MPRYYLNDFPKPFVVDGKPDFAIIFGIDSRRWLDKERPREVRDRDDLKFADITDAVNFMNLVFLLGKVSLHELPQDCVFVRNWLDDHELAELKKRNLILVGSGKVNPLWRSYEEALGESLTLRFKYDEKDIPEAIIYQEKEIYHSSDKLGGVGFVQIASNPDSPEKAILLIAGFHGKGTSGACLALAKRLKDINEHRNVVACITKPTRTRRLGDVFNDAEILKIIPGEETVDDREQLKEDKKHLEWLLAKQKENLRKVEKKIAGYAGDPPLKLINQKEDILKEIKETEEKLEALRE